MLRFLWLSGLLALGLTSLLRAEEPADWAKKNAGDLVAIYREFHANPELSLKEEKTAARLAKLLQSAGVEVTTSFGGHGVVGLVKNGAGPTLLLRADMDGLPVTEKTDLAFASKVKTKNKEGVEVGVMHACGHDIHMTSLVGVTRYLLANKDRWSGTLLIVGQPAEEQFDGAKRMLDAGLFEKYPKPNFGLALHVDSLLAAGKIEHRAGFVLANVDSVDITMIGRGGHGAVPHRTIDPIVLAAHLIMDLQTLVSRETNPIESAVVTVGSIHAGTKHNIISSECKMQLTVRSYSEKVRKHLIEGIERKAKAVADGAGAPAPIVKLSEDTTPAVFNDEKLVARLVPVFERAIGKENVAQGEASMGGEDFSRYGLAGVPIFMFRLGSVEPMRLAGYTRLGQEPPSLHSALYYPDAEPTIITGVTTMSAAVLDLLPTSGK